MIQNGELLKAEKYNKQFDHELYEVVRIVDSKLLYFEEHFKRLEGSLAFYGLEDAIERQLLLSYARQLIKQEEAIFNNLWIRAYLSQGEIDIHMTIEKGTYPSSSEYEHGVQVKTMDISRVNPSVKEYREEYKKATREFIKTNSIKEAILCSDRKITEGTMSNLFFIKDDKIYSADREDILRGITWLKVVDLIKEENIEIIEGDILIDRLDTFEACFLTGTSINILPIRKFNEKEFDVKNKTLGLLMKKFDEKLEKYFLK